MTIAIQYKYQQIRIVEQRISACVEYEEREREREEKKSSSINTYYHYSMLSHAT